MSLVDYKQSREIAEGGYSFRAIVMAAFRRADTFNAERLRAAFPDIYAEVSARYEAPGGRLEGEKAE